MKTLNVKCTTVKHTINAIQSYPVLENEWLILPPDFIFSPSHTNYNLYITFEHDIQGEKMRLNIAIPLFKETVKVLLQNGGEEKLMRVALTIKHNRLIKYMWHHISDEGRRTIMAEVLGGK